MSDDIESQKPDLPDERIVLTEDGEKVTVRETVDAVTVSATHKVQLEQYEPISGHASLEADKPGPMRPTAFDDWVEGLGELARAYAEREVVERFEQHVRE